jgi:hypothetical protein
MSHPGIVAETRAEGIRTLLHFDEQYPHYRHVSLRAELERALDRLLRLTRRGGAGRRR